MAPWDWDELNRRRRMIRFYRGQVVSAYMKAVRLMRPADALYWLAILYYGKAGMDYLRRRLFCSAGEDNCDVWVMEHCEEILARKEEKLRPMLYAAYASTIGTKWYERPDGRAYTRARAAAGLAPHPNPQPTT